VFQLVDAHFALVSPSTASGGVASRPDDWAQDAGRGVMPAR
jgi:hypothetical protein